MGTVLLNLNIYFTVTFIFRKSIAFMNKEKNSEQRKERGNVDGKACVP